MNRKPTVELITYDLPRTIRPFGDPYQPNRHYLSVGAAEAMGNPTHVQLFKLDDGRIAFRPFKFEGSGKKWPEADKSTMRLLGKVGTSGRSHRGGLSMAGMQITGTIDYDTDLELWVITPDEE